MNKQEPVNCSDSELCTFLQELAAGFLPTFYSDISQSAQSKSMSIASKSYQRGRKTVSFHGFQSLTMCKHSTDGHGAESLTLLPEDFRVKTSASPGKVPESTESAAAYGVKWRASLAKYDHDSRSWKTAQRSFIEDSGECSVIWPHSGMTVNGECLELPMLVRRTKETDCGLWRTPSANVIEAKSTVVKLTGRKPTDPQVGLANQVMASQKWPTPRARDHPPNGGTPGSTIDLPNVVKRRMFPTAIATAYKGWSPNHNRSDTNDRLDYTIERDGYTNGQKTPPMRLNPDWVEWLMGWPIGWTGLKQLETDRCHCAQQQHGECSRNEEKTA